MENEKTTPIVQAQTIAQNETVLPEPKSVIEIGTLESILGIIVILISVGIAWGKIKTIIEEIKGTLDTKIEPDLKNVRERFGIVESKVESLWKDKYAPGSSPRQLNERGTSILEESGIKEIIDKNKAKLLKAVKDKNMKNAYDAENAIFSVMQELSKHCPDVEDKLKEGAFRSGADFDGVLFVGAIYLRDLIFEDLGFKLNELDKSENMNKT